MALSDIYQKASLVQIPSGYKSGTLYSVVPNTADGDFTVTGDPQGEATRVNKDGLIETVSANVPRLNYDFIDGVVQPDPHLLLEPTRQNIIQYSELFNNSYWTKESVTIGTGIVSPMGDTDAQNVIEDTTTGRHRVRASLAVSSGTTYSLSVWAKSANRNLVINADVLFNARSGFNLSTGIVENTISGAATITAFPNDWYLCTVTGTATSTQTTVAYLQAQIGTTDANYTGDGSSTLSLFGAQLEAGSYATSYIPTSGSAVTRTADTCEKSSVASGIIGQTEGVIFLDFENYGQIGTSYGNHFKIESAGNNDRVAIQSDAASLNRLILVINDGSSTFFQPREDISLGRNKIAIKYKSGDIDAYINGVKEQVSTTSFSFANTLNKIYIGQPNKVYQAMVFNKALTDAELTTLTT